MISCSTFRGNTNSPISNFNCLKEDIPFLPINYPEYELTNIRIDFNKTKEMQIKSNNIINKIHFDNIPLDTYYIHISNIRIYSANEQNDSLEFIEYKPFNLSSEKKEIFGNIAPTDKKIFINRNNPLIKGMKVNISKIIEEEIQNIKKVGGSNLKNIAIRVKAYNSNNQKIAEKDITLEIKESNKNKQNINHFNNKEYIPNGSIAFVMDTSEVYMFDEENDRWLKI